MRDLAFAISLIFENLGKSRGAGRAAFASASTRHLYASPPQTYPASMTLWVAAMTCSVQSPAVDYLTGLGTPDITKLKGVIK